MKLDRDNNAGNVIRSFAGGRILIGDLSFDQPVIVTVDRIISDWPAPEIETLSLADMQPVLALEPEVILLGTGTHQRFPASRVSTAILSQGVGIEVMDTAAACRTFNVLASEFRRVAAVLYTN